MKSKQSSDSQKSNEVYFLNYIDEYGGMVGELDSYENIRTAINLHIDGLENLVDIGNGGVFAYDTNLVKKITAIDLFLDSLDFSKYPKNVILRQGDALNLEVPETFYDAVIFVMLIHHLVGENVKDTHENLTRCISEAHKVLKPGGKLIIVESCVPSWLYKAEKILFPISNYLISKFLTHPMAFQYTSDMVANKILEFFGECEVQKIPKGKYIIQLGFKVRSFLTPVEAFIFTAHKSFNN